jgi:RNA polymerase sigma-70 factor (ECF subfamily)
MLASNFTNEQLLDLIKQGNEEAFKVFYERFWSKLYLLAKNILQSEEDAEEVVHDVFLTLWEKSSAIKIQFTLESYLAAMTKYACLKLLARSKRSAPIIRLDQTVDLQDHSTEQWLDFDDLRHELEKCITDLPQKCQEIFRYSREKGLSDKEIAEKMNISVNTVRTQIYRALRKLKTDFQSFISLF